MSSNQTNNSLNRNPSYSYEAQAKSLFDFLKKTFFQMPKGIQILGWLVFLFLFVFLVLYPLLGISYFQGKVVRITQNENGERTMYAEKGLRIYRGATTYTNEDGEFTMPVRVPYLPFVDVDFDFGEGEQRELVSLSGPPPLVSLFNPNRKKIFYVPGSMEKDKFGIAKHYFLNAREACEAIKNEPVFDEDNSPQNSVDELSILYERSHMSGMLYAMEKVYVEPKYTLCIREINVLDLKKSKEVYFDIVMDDQSMRFDNIPHASSSKSKRLTVFPDIPVKFRDLDIPLSVGEHHIRITILEARLIGETKVGSVGFRIGPDEVGSVFEAAGDNLELKLELLPPVALGFMAIPSKKARNFLVALRLDIPPDYLDKIEGIQYDLGQDFKNRLVMYPEIGKSDYYGYLISLFSPTTVKARVSFIGGSTIDLARNLRLPKQDAESPIDDYFLGRLYLSDDQDEMALRYFSKSIEGSPEFPQALRGQAIVFVELGRFDEAKAAYERALELDPDDCDTLNSFAWFIADEQPDPQPSDLLEAKEMAEKAIRIRQAPGYYDTLGWIFFKLRDYEEAINFLSQAQKLQEKISKDSTNWQGINYHLGYVYLRLGRSAEAKTAFQEVLNYQKKYPYVSIDKYVRDTLSLLEKFE